jgi:hypothetical protein
MSDVSQGSARKGEWFRTGVAVSGWVAALLMGILDLPAAINDFRREWPAAAEATGLSTPLDKRFRGAWGRVPTCEVDAFEVGDLTEEEPTKKADLDLTLEFEGDAVSGEIISDGLMRHYVFPEVTMVGQVSGATAHMRVFDWIGGKATTLAEIEIVRVGNDCLEFKAVGESTTLFPERAFLGRQSAAAYNSIPRESEMMKRVLNRLQK